MQSGGQCPTVSCSQDKHIHVAVVHERESSDLLIGDWHYRHDVDKDICAEEGAK